MSLNEHNRSQIEAALSPENRWHASRHYGKEVTDTETLLRYFIKHGGAEFYGKRRRKPPQDQCGDDGSGPQREG
jgi:hypothetical protein